MCVCVFFFNKSFETRLSVVEIYFITGAYRHWFFFFRIFSYFSRVNAYFVAFEFSEHFH